MLIDIGKSPDQFFSITTPPRIKWREKKEVWGQQYLQDTEWKEET